MSAWRRRRPSTAHGTAGVSFVALLLAIFAVLVLAAQLSPQTATGAIRGRVTDGTGNPLRGAEALLANSAFHATSDSAGGFFLAAVPPGRYSLVVRHVGYEAKRFTATVFADDTIEAPIVLQVAATPLDTVVSVATIPAPRRLEEYAAIRRSGIGILFDSTDIAKHGADNVSDLLRTKANGIDYWPRSCGGTAIASNTIGGIVDMTVSKKVRILNVNGCKAPNACYAQIFVDGVRIYTYNVATLPPDIDHIADLAMVEAIEFYKSGAPAPAEYNTTGSACGTISIWLKR